MSTIINRVSFKNFFFFYGDYKKNSYTFSKGLNIIVAFRGMGKSSFFNGILWILRDQIYDSDTLSIKSARLESLNMLSDRAKLEEDSPECGVIIEFEDERFRYVVEKRIKFKKIVVDASTCNSKDWNISEPIIDINKTDLLTNHTTCVYDIEEQKEIISNKLIDRDIQPYALLQGKAIYKIVDLANYTKLTNAVETQTNIKELNEVFRSCENIEFRLKKDLSKKTNKEGLNSKVEKRSNLSGGGISLQYTELVDIISDATQIFDNTKKRIYDEVLSNLEMKSNEYYRLLTEGNNVIGGTMRFEKTSYDIIEVKVINEKGDELSGASEEFQRITKMAVVMAIISYKVGEKIINCPFITDEPFLPFDNIFNNNFLKIAPSVFKQSIILTAMLYDITDNMYLSETSKIILKKIKNGKIAGTLHLNSEDDGINRLI